MFYNFIHQAKINFKNIFLNSIATSNVISPSIRRKIYNMFGNNIEGIIQARSFLGFGKGKLVVAKIAI